MLGSLIPGDDITKVPEPLPRSSSSSGALSLLILGGNQLHQVPLPEDGTLTVGREQGADVRIDDAAVSRRHVQLVVRGREVTLKDLGSQNGTRVRGVRVIGELALRPGDVIEVGNTCLVLQAAEVQLPGRGVEDFERALTRGCREASRTFGVVLVRPDGPVEQVRAALGAALGPEETIHALSGGELGALAQLGHGRSAEALLERLQREISARKLQARVGVANFPADGAVPDALLSAARSSMRTLGERPLSEEVGGSIVVRSHAMEAVYATMDSVAAATISVLITGETGSGKQVLAEAIHARSVRRDRPFVRINCAAMPEPLLEAELFGYEKGAFTGALKDKVGLIEHSAGGTFMLDEVGDMPLGLQAKLLQVLEERGLRRVGGLEFRPVDLRVVAATNRDPEQLIAEGRFRADLFWRLCGIQIAIPPLRERKEDILALADRFLEVFSQETQRPRPRLDPEASQLLLDFDWPGNVRQLRNAMERAFLLATDGVIHAAELSRWLQGAPAAAKPAAKATVPPSAPLPMRQELLALERDRILAALQDTGNNQTRAAALLGMPRRTLIEKIERYGLPRPRKQKDPP